MKKIYTIEEIQTIPRKVQEIKNQMILVGGCFDLIHPGHLSFFESAKSLDGSLVVMLESDKTVERLKGAGRPLHSQEERAKILSHIDLVDFVLLLPPLSTDAAYREIITLLQPHIIAVTKDDAYKEKKELHAAAVGARVVPVIDRQKKHASTTLIKKLHL